MCLDYFFTNCFKSPKFSEVIFKKHNLKVYANYVKCNLTRCYRAFSLTWPARMQIYRNKKKCLHEKRVQLPEDWSGTPTWPLFHCFGTPI